MHAGGGDGEAGDAKDVEAAVACERPPDALADGFAGHIVALEVGAHQRRIACGGRLVIAAFQRGRPLVEQRLDADRVRSGR